MVWYISPTVNHRYPYNTDFVGIIPDYLIDGKYNYSFWRIDTTGKINNGYPYNYYMVIRENGQEGGTNKEQVIARIKTFGGALAAIKLTYNGELYTVAHKTL